MDSPFSPLSRTIPTLLQSRARHCAAYCDSPLAPTPVAPPRRATASRTPFPLYRSEEHERQGMGDSCSVNSSPSLYSHAPSHIGHGQYAAQMTYGQRPTTRRWDDEDDQDRREYEEAPCTQSRISMVSGPRVTKYADIPWEEFAQAEAKGSSGNIGRMIRAATRTNAVQPSRSRPGSPAQSSGTMSTETTRKGLSIFGGGGGGGAKGKNFMASSSGVSLASTKTVSTASSDERAQPATPQLKVAYGSPPSPNRTEILEGARYDDGVQAFGSFKAGGNGGQNQLKLDPSPIPHHLSPQVHSHAHHGDRPLLSSGSPGFGLISLEAAQERERLRSNRRTGGAQIGQPTPKAVANRASHASTSTTDTEAGSMAKSVKPKKSLMKLFKNDKSGASFSIVTPSMPSVPRMPSSTVTTRDPTSTGRSDMHDGNSPWHDAADPMAHQVDSPKIRPPQDAAPAVTNTDSRFLRPRLELRPISMNFANGLPSSYLSDVSSMSSASSSPPRSALLTPADQDPHVAEAIKEQIANARKGWMVQLFELEAQIRELKDQLAEATTVRPGRCDVCGCSCGGQLTVGGGDKDLLRPGGGVMDRGRAKTGGARGVFGSGSLYEWE